MTAVRDDAAAWHDVECGAYAADLPLWEELAAAAPGPLLELGSGTGRVALHLARRGHDVVAVERDQALAAALRRRRGERVEVVVGDACALDLGRRFPLVIAPMQLVQLLPGDGRRRLLRAVAAHLEAGGRAAFALAAAPAGARDCPPPPPDVREVDGWVYSSRPIALRRDDGGFAVARLRQRVSPAGELDEEVEEVRLATLDPGRLEAEARGASLVARDRRRVPPTAEHVGSTVVLLERR